MSVITLLLQLFAVGRLTKRAGVAAMIVVVPLYTPCTEPVLVPLDLIVATDSSMEDQMIFWLLAFRGWQIARTER